MDVIAIIRRPRVSQRGKEFVMVKNDDVRITEGIKLKFDEIKMNLMLSSEKLG